MNPAAKAETVKRFREATGMGWMAAKLFFAGRSAELCERILRAHQEQQGEKSFHDPLEDDPKFKDQIAVARKAAELDHKGWIVERNRKLCESGRAKEIREWPLGSCHRVWGLMKTHLKQSGITWYSPAEMNPGSHFD